jgi:transposase
MRDIRVWARLVGLRRAVVEGVRIGDEGEVVVAVRPGWRERDRCGICRRRSPGYDLVAWLAVNTSKTAVAELQRVAWRTVERILERMAAEARREVDLLDGLRRIEIDEISHRKGRRYLVGPHLGPTCRLEPVSRPGR